jgi:hypothetical protein
MEFFSLESECQRRFLAILLNFSRQDLSIGIGLLKFNKSHIIPYPLSVFTRFGHQYGK